MANVYVRGYGGVGRLLPRGEFKIPTQKNDRVRRGRVLVTGEGE